MAKQLDERNFENEVERSLLDLGGYVRAEARDFDAEVALARGELSQWIRRSQPDAWARLVTRYGGSVENAELGLARRISDQITSRGVIEVLRRGVNDQGVSFQTAVFKPATSMNQSQSALYEMNRLAVVRQFRYSRAHTRTVDIVLLINGLPVATAELKNPLTGQSVDDAIAQYSNDRDPSDRVLGRMIVHFAVDPFLVYMTTRLAGQRTVFLPFNRGDDGSKGNPALDGGFPTRYLWEEVWAKDPWLDLIGRFVTAAGGTRGHEVIFPRYHQWDAVKKIERHAREAGTGHRYLIQHSAGSGKSNTIAWLAHRLASLHDATEQRVFDKIIVITDRRVLDEQLRKTVGSFERVTGTVVNVTGRDQSKTADLLEALELPSAKIVVTTLQVFPYLFGEVPEDVASRRYAVIVDEAHSSQTGEAAFAVRHVLGGAARRAGVDDADDDEDVFNALVSGSGNLPNVSFFAFTATPKSRTIEIFGSLTGTLARAPFHLYSMRQAIEEGFILDVLRNYSSYDTYFRIAVSEELASTDVAVADASRALRRFVVSNPAVISQKARIIVEHFMAHTAEKIRGEAKAMVVTDSRRAAVSYKQAIDSYCSESGYALSTLVAFSGTLSDEILGTVSESSMNQFPDSQTASRFSSGDYRVLVVANKFQTGFDEPRLHTLFVDKQLSGVSTVQTLSRLNRIHPDKFDTFILDFRNSEGSVQRDFQRFYNASVAVPTNANALADAFDHVTRDWEVLDADEIDEVSRRFFVGSLPRGAVGALYEAYQPALTRFRSLSDDDGTAFKTALSAYIDTYVFMSQVLPWTDSKFERTYLYCRALLKLVPTRSSGQVELGREVVLTHLRLESSFNGGIELDSQYSSSPPSPATGGLPVRRQATRGTLGRVAEELNREFGLGLTEVDQLTFEQFEVSWLANAELKEVAEANTLDSFKLEFDRVFRSTVVQNENANQALYSRIYSDADFSATIRDFYVTKVYDELRGSREGPTSGAEPAGASVGTLSESRDQGTGSNRDRLMRRLRLFLDLDFGWLDGEGLPPTPGAMREAQEIIERAHESALIELRLFPTEDGDLQFERTFGSLESSLLLSGSGFGVRFVLDTSSPDPALYERIALDDLDEVFGRLPLGVSE